MNENDLIKGDNDFSKAALFHHRFWLQIMGDHARFIYHALSPDEKEKIKIADYFIVLFDELLEQARKQLTIEQTGELTKQAYSFTEEIRKFKLDLIRDHLTRKIQIGLPPTFINHMVNEAEEYLRILQNLLEMKMPVGHPLHYHNLWLPDAAGHASGIKCRLDDVESDLIMESEAFEKEFNNLYIKAEEFSGYTRTKLIDFPALDRLNQQVRQKIDLFMKFLKYMEALRLSKKAVGTLSPLIPDHMYREECYYIYNLSRVSEIQLIECDPTAPRINVD